MLLAGRASDSPFTFGPPAPLELLLVGGTPVVERGELRTIDMTAATREVRAARLRLEPGT